MHHWKKSFRKKWEVEKEKRKLMLKTRSASDRMERTKVKAALAKA